MKYQVVSNGKAGIVGIYLEADRFLVGEQGELCVMKADKPLVVYAAGVWRAIADTGAMQGAVVAPPSEPETPQNENPRRPKAQR